MRLLSTALRRQITYIKSGAKRFDISIVVPIYNTERYLADCIDSILAQTKDRLQIILVDDGSTDNSGSIGRAYAKRYTNVTYTYKENSGVAATRNLGASLASGEYLAFVDSDDLLDPHMMERLYKLAKQFKSDIVTCGTIHFNELTSFKYPSPLYDNVFKREKITTGTLETLPNQVFNTSCCNKLFLRSFYIDKRIQCPEGQVYEDIPFSIGALAKASRITSTPEKLYLYRVRTGNNFSITQQRHDIQNLKDRILALKTTLSKLEESSKTIQKAFQDRTIKHDLKLHFRSFPTINPKLQPEAAAVIANYVDDCIDPDVLEASSSLAKLKIELCREGKISELNRVIAYESGAHKKAPIHLQNGRLFTKAPAFIGEDFLDVSKEVFWPEPITSIEHISLEYNNEDCSKNALASGLLICGKIYQKYVPIIAGEQHYHAFLTDEFNNEVAELEIFPCQPKRILQSHKVMRNLYDQSIIDYSGSGFALNVPLETFNKALLVAKKANPTTENLLIRIDYKNKLFSGSIYASKPDKSVRELTATLNGLDFAPGGWLRISDCAQAINSLAVLSAEPNNGQTNNSEPLPVTEESCTPLLSIVVPIHGDDSDLPAALDSLTKQSLNNMQIILVDDDTSLDGGTLARLYSCRYKRFEYLKTKTSTLGEACNAGVKLARGAYLAFASPYDSMAPQAYEHLVNLATSDNANIVAGDIVHAFDRDSEKPCNLARKAYGNSSAKMNITKHPELLYSSMPWNHLFKRSFYEAKGLAWPENAKFEDSRLMIQAFFATNEISYLPEPIFLWRKRNRNYASIERQADQVAALIEKIALLKQADAALAKICSDKSILELNAFKRLDLDLRSDLLQLPSAPEEKQKQACEALCAYLQTLPKEAFNKLRAIERMKYHFTISGNFEQLVKLREYELGDYKLLNVRQDEQGNYLGDFPFNGLDASFFNMTKGLKHSGLNTNINDIKVEGSALKVTGQIFPYRIAVPNKEDIQLSAVFIAFNNGNMIKADIELKKSKKETRSLSAPSGEKLTIEQPYRSYTLLIPFKQLQGLASGDYRLHAYYSLPNLNFSPIALGKPLANKNLEPFEFTAGKTKVFVSFGLSNELVLSVKN